MKYKRIKIPIYGSEVIITTGNYKECMTKLKKLIGNNDLDDTSNNAGECMTFNSGRCTIWLAKHIDISTLVHEITHAVLWLLDFVGMVHSTKTTEAYAYLSSYIYDEYKDTKGWKTVTKKKKVVKK